jgi:hypothetical protein
MKHTTQLWLLSPHALSVVSFAAAFVWISYVGTNRTDPDLYLGITGFVALAVALITTIAGVVAVFRHGAGRHWPWLLAHLAALALALAIAFGWLGAHVV